MPLSSANERSWFNYAHTYYTTNRMLDEIRSGIRLRRTRRSEFFESVLPMIFAVCDYPYHRSTHTDCETHASICVTIRNICISRLKNNKHTYICAYRQWRANNDENIARTVYLKFYSNTLNFIQKPLNQFMTIYIYICKHLAILQ